MAEQWLDVSELEAPEPLLRAIAALERLPAGDFLHFCHRMQPCHLYRFLQENGFVADTRRGNHCECELFIWRADDEQAAAQADTAATGLAPWEEV
ncbi:MAG: DUF2249 domain-containing protein [Pseudomonadota bacterium]